MRASAMERNVSASKFRAININRPRWRIGPIGQERFFRMRCRSLIMDDGQHNAEHRSGKDANLVHGWLVGLPGAWKKNINTVIVVERKQDFFSYD